MTTPRHAYEIGEIKAMLTLRAAEVAQAYAPAAQGSYMHGGDWWTLNPGRADARVGSFVVHVAGARAGRWQDFATKEGGDLLDLIRIAMATDMTGAIKEARGYLGLVNEPPAAIARRKALAAEGAARQAEAQKKAKAEAAQVARKAKGLWLAGLPMAGTPVEYYLRDTRGIDLRRLGRAPGSLRYLKSASYKDLDPETGEVIEGKWPCMVAMVTDLAGNTVAIHRTWLAIDPGTGRWDKAPVPKPKKVWGDYAGACIRVWSGADPGRQRAIPLKDVRPGATVMLAEGIEDALSAAMLVPEARILAGISLSNLGGVVLPKNVAEITIIGDRDPKPETQAALTRAIDLHAARGRIVRLWQNDWGGKDLNDALRQAQQDQPEAAE